MQERSQPIDCCRIGACHDGDKIVLNAVMVISAICFVEPRVKPGNAINAGFRA